MHVKVAIVDNEVWCFAVGSRDFTDYIACKKRAMGMLINGQAGGDFSLKFCPISCYLN